MCVLVAWSTVMVASGFMNVAEIFLAKRAVQRGRLRLRPALGRHRHRDGDRRCRCIDLIKRDLGAAYVRFLALFAVGIGVRRRRAERLGRRRGDDRRGDRQRRRGRRQHHVRAEGRARPPSRPCVHAADGVNYGALGASFVAAGPVTNAIGPRWTYVVAAVGIGFASGLAWLFARGVEAETQAATA